MAEFTPLFDTQRAFTAHLRDPERHPRPRDVDERRMQLYRELFYNNVEGFVSSGFPVLRSVYDDPSWHRLVRGFFARHRCRSPYFAEIAREFLHYLEHEHVAEASDPPYLLELAHYEWVELALQLRDETLDPPDVDRDGDLVSGIPVTSPLAWTLSYRYPVHRIGRDFQPREPSPAPSHLLVVRDREDRVRFHEINAVTARLMQLLTANEHLNGHEILLRIAEELPDTNIDTVVAGGRAMLENLRHQDALLGTRRQAQTS